MLFRSTKLGQGSKDDPEDVAEDGFEAVMKGKPHVVAGSFKNKLMAETATHMPDRLSGPGMGAQAKPREKYQQADESTDQPST